MIPRSVSACDRPPARPIAAHTPPFGRHGCRPDDERRSLFAPPGRLRPTTGPAGINGRPSGRKANRVRVRVIRISSADRGRIVGLWSRAGHVFRPIPGLGAAVVVDPKARRLRVLRRSGAGHRSRPAGGWHFRVFLCMSDLLLASNPPPCYRSAQFHDAPPRAPVRSQAW